MAALKVMSNALRNTVSLADLGNLKRRGFNANLQAATYRNLARARSSKSTLVNFVNYALIFVAF